MINTIMNAVQAMIQQLVSMPVVVGSMPPEEGYAVGYAGGAPIETFRTLNANYTLPIVFNGKSADQQKLVEEMDRVHLVLTTSKVLPFSDDWQIYSITTSAAPQLLGREENRNWIYGSSLRVLFYMRGVKTNA